MFPCFLKENTLQVFLVIVKSDFFKMPAKTINHLIREFRKLQLKGKDHFKQMRKKSCPFANTEKKKVASSAFIMFKRILNGQLGIFVAEMCKTHAATLQ